MKLQDFEKKIIIIAVVLLVAFFLFSFYSKSAKIRLKNFKVESINQEWNFPTKGIDSVIENLDEIKEIQNSEEIDVLQKAIEEGELNQQQEQKNEEQ